MTVADGLCGTGAGWRPEIAAVLETTNGLGFCEMIAESVRPDALPAPLLAHAGRGAALVPLAVEPVAASADRHATALHCRITRS